MRRAALVVVAVFSLAVFSLIGLAPHVGAAKPGRSPNNHPVSSPPALKQAEAVGWGGAVSSVDPDATAVGIRVLRRGGNAADAAIATAAALGVTEPYSAGIGGGGFLVYYDARTRKVSTIDGRETAPATFTPEVFIDKATGTPLTFASVVNSGLSVGVPGTPALWESARKRFGRWSLNRLLRPAEKLARNGFVVDSTFNAQSAANAARFRTFPETERVYLPGGEPAGVGSTFRNPDLARSYRILRQHGVRSLYRGRLGAAMVQAARNPATQPGVSVYSGQITRADLREYRARSRKPVKGRYRGLQAYGMPVPSLGGIAVGEALNLLEAYDRARNALVGRRPGAVPAPAG